MKLSDSILRVDELTHENIMRVFDVAFDIHKQLNIGQDATVRITAAPQAVKFRQLLPHNTPPALNEYETGRQQACAFLREIGVIASYRVLNEHAQRVMRQIEVEVADSVGLSEVLERLQVRLSGQAAQKSKASAELAYDTENGYLRYGDKTIGVKDGTLQHYICKLTFENRGSKVTELDIIDEWGGAEKQQSIYDACRLLNSKAENMFGIDRLLICKEGKVWLNTSL